MPKRLSVALVLLALLPAPATSQAQLNGFLSIDKRFNIGMDNVIVEDFYNRFRPELSAPVGDRLYLQSSLDLRFYDLPRANSLSELEDIGSLFPTDLSVWEAYVELTGFLFDDLDVQAGKQRIAWGRADRFNPTDNLNPDDFSDFIEFGEKMPSWAIEATYYFDGFGLTGVWLPSLTPVLLPRGASYLFLGGENAAGADTLLVPDAKLENSMLAVKLDGAAGSWDYSFSFFSGYDDMPVASIVAVTVKGDESVAGYTEFVFPRLHVVGADVVTELGGIGLWGEVGVYRNEKIITQTVSDAGYAEEVGLDDRPYFKFTIGGDHTFPGGRYVNTQWVHGFFTERGAGNLHDFLFATLEEEVLRDEVELSLGGALEVGNWGNISDSYGLAFFPAITYEAIDNLDATVGVFLVTGQTESLFGSWSTVDQVFLRAKVYF